MPFVYPVNMPTNHVASALRFSPRSAVAVSESPFTFSEEVFEHQGQAWEVSVTLPPMQRDDAEEWIAFLLSLNGSSGTFLMGDPVGATPRGTGVGTPLVDGVVSARSKVLTTKGWNPSDTVLKAGDYIQLPNNRLHKVLQDVTSDVSGDATLDLWPYLREGLSGDEAIVINDTVGVWRLFEGIPEWDVEGAQVYGINFKARESISA